MAESTNGVIIGGLRFRRATTRRWQKLNTVLGDGEPGYDVDAQKFKIGNGITPWNELSYYEPKDTSDTPTDLVEHVFADEPHPAYDDAPSLVLLYQNAKV